MYYFSRFTFVLLIIAVFLFTGCSYQDNSVKEEGESSSVKYTGVNESMKLTQAKSLPVLKIDPTQLRQKESLEILKMQNRSTFYRGSKYQRQIALTFDDGPDNHYTPQILDILKQENIKATFFVVGRMIQKYPDTLKRIYQEGHTIGNHSLTHPVLPNLSNANVNKQLDVTNNMIMNIIDRSPFLFRPPYGAMNKGLEKLVASKGYKIIYWDVDTVDWDNKTAPEILQTVKEQSKSGSIILQHCAGDSSIQATVQALPTIIDYFKQQGYQFVTIDQLIHAPAYASTTNLPNVSNRTNSTNN
jgi:polysaccharide deacetylase family sporulation protein PdaB